MGKVPLRDMIEAEWFALRSFLTEPKELRRTPVQYQRLRDVAQEDVRWTEFVSERSVIDALHRQVGVVAVDKDELLAGHSVENGAEIGMLRAIGKKAVVLARWPRHVLLDFMHSHHKTPWILFGVQMDRPVLRIAPAVVTQGGGIHVPDTGISPTGPVDLETVPEWVRVY